MEKKGKIVVGISVGDLNGIGIEVILKTFDDKRMLDFCTPILFASSKLISIHKKQLSSEAKINGISSIKDLTHNRINVLNCWKEEVPVDFGKVTKVSGEYALKSLEIATTHLKDGTIDVLLTAPISKESIQSDDFHFPGHTEFLENQLEGESLMILISEGLRVGLITGHIPVAKVSESINPELIIKKTAIMHKSLVEDFGISKPKIAILGLNPHCGDHGVIGKEDDEIIRPTIHKIQESGQLVFGPYAADGFFGSQNYKEFDAILAMYHDQGLAPFKALSFGSGVNYTAGLSKIRTSPDHGTAFEIAGKNKASAESFKAALFCGIEIFKQREEYKVLTHNPLAVK